MLSAHTPAPHHILGGHTLPSSTTIQIHAKSTPNPTIICIFGWAPYALKCRGLFHKCGERGARPLCPPARLPLPTPGCTPADSLPRYHDRLRKEDGASVVRLRW